MTSGLIKTFASPRRGNETFQLRRMARIFWVRRKSVWREKIYFILFCVVCWGFFHWTERFYLMDIHWEMFRKIDQIWIDCTASQMNRETFFFVTAYFKIVLSQEVWCLSLSDYWFPWIVYSNCTAPWWVGSAWWSELKTKSRGKPNWFLLDQWLSDSLHALRAGRKWGQTRYEI